MSDKRSYQQADQGGYSALQKYWKIHGWKPRQIQYLKNNWQNKTDREMKNAFLNDKTLKAISGKRRELNLIKTPLNRKFWSEAEEQILRDNYQNNTVKQIANDFLPNKTASQIKEKVNRLRLSKPRWTIFEVDLLVEHGEKYTARDIVKKFLPNKTVEDVYKKRQRIGLKRLKHTKAAQIRRDKEQRLRDKEQREQKAAARKEMVLKVFNLREQGLTFVQIGKEMGCSHWFAGQLYNQFKKIYLK